MTDNIMNNHPTGGRSGGIEPGQGTTAKDELTARVRIRDAALMHFAEVGYERATIRAIARTAGVSHGMLRHHFGSKVDLRAACDDYVFRVLHRLNALFPDIPSTADPSLQSSNPLWRYAARSLVDGSPTAAPIFSELVLMTARRMAPLGDEASDHVAAQNQVQAALVAAMMSAIPLFHDHLSVALGLDIFSADGDALLSDTLRELFAKGRPDEAPITMATTHTSR